MTTPEGFQPCLVEASKEGGAFLERTARSELCLLIVGLIVHIGDVGLHLLVTIIFFASHQWGFFSCAGGIILWAWLVSSLYKSFSGSQGSLNADQTDRSLKQDSADVADSFCWASPLCTEAYRCVCYQSDTDFFHTMRLMEAILESAPTLVVHVYALVSWASHYNAPPYVSGLLWMSITISVISVSLGLAMWEQKVQIQSSLSYTAKVTILRLLEVSSRTFTLALFASLTHPYGLWWLLFMDYGIMVLLIIRHQYVQLSYGIFVALPLVLVSLEPLVWGVRDHAVPKESYYSFRIGEIVLIWLIMYHRQTVVYDDVYSGATWYNCQFCAIVCTVCFYCLLPFVWQDARRRQLPCDDSWSEEDRIREDGLADDLSSDSGLARSGSDEAE